MDFEAQFSSRAAATAEPVARVPIPSHQYNIAQTPMARETPLHLASPKSPLRRFESIN
jgi:hypothetical protein